MKIYTRTGDDGSSGLIGGRRVSKSDRRLECYGTIDELNAALGLATVALEDEDALAAPVRGVQNDLFVLGSHLAAPDATSAAKLPALSQEMVNRLEREIDLAEATLPALRAFILPGGGEAGARLHLARTICRRAERQLSSLSAQQPVPTVAGAYLNRLSDWLFVMARRANHARGVEEVTWRGGTNG